MNGFDGLIKTIQTEVRARALSAATKNTKFVLGKLGHDAGAVGAASLARTLLGK